VVHSHPGFESQRYRHHGRARRAATSCPAGP